MGIKITDKTPKTSELLFTSFRDIYGKCLVVKGWGE